MRDPDEGLDSAGRIVTGVRRERVPADFEPVLAAVVGRLTDASALYVYGSLATGRAVRGRSDVDVLAIGVDPDVAGEVTLLLSRQFSPLAREVAVGVLPGLPTGEGSEAYGNRVFLRHYCVAIHGPDPASLWPAFPGDVRAARGFNGNLPSLLGAWLEASSDEDPGPLARRVARKTLFAVSGLVSVHDSTWTTDRAFASKRWASLQPALRADLDRLWRWGEGEESPTRSALRDALHGVVAQVAAEFAEVIGCW